MFSSPLKGTTLKHKHLTAGKLSIKSPCEVCQIPSGLGGEEVGCLAGAGGGRRADEDVNHASCTVTLRSRRSHTPHMIEPAPAQETCASLNANSPSFSQQTHWPPPPPTCASPPSLLLLFFIFNCWCLLMEEWNLGKYFDWVLHSHPKRHFWLSTTHFIVSHANSILTEAARHHSKELYNWFQRVSHWFEINLCSCDVTPNA